MPGDLLMKRTLSLRYLFAYLLLFGTGCDSGGSDDPSSGSTGNNESTSETPENNQPTESLENPQADEQEGNDHPDPTEQPITTWEEGFGSAFRFVDNWALLHTFDTGLFINFGSPAALKYVQGRWLGSWRAGEVDEGRPVAWTNGIREFVRFPVDEVDEDLELVLRMRGAADDLRMDVFLNSEDALRTVSNIPGFWGEVRVTLPQEDLIEGENTVRFHFSRTVDSGAHGRTAGGFDYVRIQPVGVDPFEEHRDGHFVIVEADGGSQALSGPVYSTISAYVTVPEEARLRADVQVVGIADDQDTVPASIVVRRDGHEPEVLWQGDVGEEVVRLEADLAELTDEVVRIDLVGGGSVGAGEILWIDPNIVVREASPRVIADEDRPRYVFVWLVDTLTTGHYPVYNPETRVQAPNFVEFSESCVNFRRNTCQGNSSLPSSASIHSSTYPIVHGVVDESRRLPRDSTLIIEPFFDAGWTSALFSSNGYVTESRRFNRDHYTTYRNFIHEEGVRPDSDFVWPIISEWIVDHSDNDWFIYFNSIDPHVPYDPPEEILQLYYPGPYTGSRISGPRSTGTLLDSLDGEVLEGDDLRYLVALHDGEITFNDIYFGQAIDFLEEQGILDDTLVVITSDHGEEFFEHGRGGHGSTVYEEVVDVPLQFCHPRSLGPGRWIDTEVEIIDMAPTVADVAGLDVPSEGIQGISLLPLMVDATPVMNRPGFSYQQDYLRGLRIGRWKYLFRGGDNDDLFDLAESALEGEDRQDDYPIVHRYMRDVMAFHLAFAETWEKSSWGFANNHSAELAGILSDSVW